MILIAVLAVAVVVLVAVVAILVPILTHQSAGGSGQAVPGGFASDSSATGADGRTRTIEVRTPDGSPADLARVAPGSELVVTGTGFDASIGIYVGVCAIPAEPGRKPSPCLGGIPKGAEEGKAAKEGAQPSVWITDDWAWKAFASHGYDDGKSGAFTARLLVPAASTDGLDCRKVACAITTRADHTAAGDRVQDMQLPIAFAQ